MWQAAIKSSSGRCVVDNVCGVGLNPESFTCYDTKVERNTVLAHVRGLGVSRGLPALPKRLPAQLCGLGLITDQPKTVYIAQWDQRDTLLRDKCVRSHRFMVARSLQTHVVPPNFLQTHRCVEMLKFSKIPNMSGWTVESCINNAEDIENNLSGFGVQR